MPERCLVPLARGRAASRDACLVEPLAVVVHGLRRAGLRGGERVAVIGGGTIGLCAVAAARARRRARRSRRAPRRAARGGRAARRGRAERAATTS